MQLNQKESDLLKDLKNQENLCIEKYERYSRCAKDPQLSELFNALSGMEQIHLDCLCQLEGGSVPSLDDAPPDKKDFSQTYGIAENDDKKNDQYLCSDLLSGEKHVSSLYDTCVFEFRDENARALLSSIQTQEQAHGKLLYDYMSANCMQS